MSKPKEPGTSNSLDEEEHIAQLLAKDARDCSLRYSSLGVYGLTPKRPTNNAPKPNTRFLKHIIRETDTHNANLKRKEEGEAKRRIKQLEKGNRSEDIRDHRNRESKRRRIETPREQRRPRDRDRDESSKRRRSHRSVDAERDYSKYDDRHGAKRRMIESEKEAGDSSRHKRSQKDDKIQHHGRRHRNHKSMGSLSEHERSSSDDDYYNSRHRRSHRSRHHRSRNDEREKEKYRDDKNRDDKNSYERDRDIAKAAKTNIHANTGSSSQSQDRTTHDTPLRRRRPPPPISDVDSNPSSTDSDPLSNLIGPRPPPTDSSHTASNEQPALRSRGRGIYKSTSSSNIDAHFGPNYDPTVDVQLDENDVYNYNNKNKAKSVPRPVPGLTVQEDEGGDGGDGGDDDWDMALEALRDRALWRRKGADRLREAGFEENIVERWKSNGAFSELNRKDEDRDVADVKWGKKGEGREWDRGKVIDEDGHVNLKPSW